MTPETARKSLVALGGEPDERFDAIEAALALAAADDADSPVAEAREIFSELAGAAARLLADNPDAARGEAEARAKLIGAVLASHGIAGDRESYDDPANANLARVLARRRGLPVALGLIWIGIARRLGWPLAGIDFPGHFLLGIQGHAQALLLDPFDGGRVLDAAGLRTLKQRLAGSEATLAPRDLSAMTDRAVVLRLANNLRVRRLEADALEPALSISQNMLRLAPREAGLMLAAGELALRVGQPRAAMLHLQAFLAAAPPPADTRIATALLDKARQSLN